jgi:pimeloyl-[acyl-carrier protein] methyl ester esterase
VQFRASDGASIVFDDEGEGRPLVFLHGLMAHRGFFERQRPLASAFRLLSVDLRGHGESRSGEGLNVARLADDVAELARHLDLEDAIVVGWSLGASVLFHLLTGAQSGRFAGAVVVDMTARVLNDDGWTLGLSEEHCAARSQAIRDDFPAFAAAAGSAIVAQPPAGDGREVADFAVAEFQRNDPAAIGALWQSLVEEDFRPLLGRIRQPVLIAHGIHSHLYGPETAAHLVGAIPDARAIGFERSGHSPHLEQPELFNSIIQEFAASLPRVREPQTTA